MAQTAIDVCNGALIKIGTEPIVSLNDNTKESNLCKLRLDRARQFILRSHPWNCALKRVTLAKLVATPAFDFTSQFELPSDCLRVITVDPELSPAPEYRVEGRKLLSYSDSHDLIYIFDLDDYTRMDVMLAETISAYLAWDICFAITQSVNMRKDQWEFYLATRRQAKLIDAQEEVHQVVGADLFLRARTDPSTTSLRGDR